METPEALQFDFVDSYARLRGDDVEVVLSGLAEVPGVTTVVLSRDGSEVAAPAEVQGTGVVRARTPRRGLTDGQWSIALGSDEQRSVDARLLVQGARPLVLLLGATSPRSVVPKPRPAPTTKQQLVRVGRGVLRRLPRPGRRTRH